MVEQYIIVKYKSRNNKISYIIMKLIIISILLCNLLYIYFQKEKYIELDSHEEFTNIIVHRFDEE